MKRLVVGLLALAALAPAPVTPAGHDTDTYFGREGG